MRVLSPLSICSTDFTYYIPGRAYLDSPGSIQPLYRQSIDALELSFNISFSTLLTWYHLFTSMVRSTRPDNYNYVLSWSMCAWDKPQPPHHIAHPDRGLNPGPSAQHSTETRALTIRPPKHTVCNSVTQVAILPTTKPIFEPPSAGRDNYHHRMDGARMDANATPN